MTTYVLLLTGGALPDDAAKQPPAPYPNEMDLARDQAGTPTCLCCTGNECECKGAEVSGHTALAVAAYKLGWKQAAQQFRVVTAFVVDGQPEADLFAAALSREVDPVAILPARSALAEALACYQHARAAADDHVVVDAEIIDDDAVKETP